MLKLMFRNFVGTVKIVKKCDRFYSIMFEFKKKAFSTFNNGIKYWDVRDHEQFEIRPIRDPSFRM